MIFCNRGDYMSEFFSKHKKSCIIAGLIIGAVIFAVYLFALFRPGFWYRDAFLYKQKAPFEGMEVYSGKDRELGYRYEMTMAKDGIKTYIVFSVNETERLYEVISDNSKNHNPDVEIYENGELVFKGTSFSGMLFDLNEEPFVETPEINFYVNGNVPEGELLPTYNWIYEVSQRVKTDIRGNAIWLIFIAVFAGTIALDMIYPDLFWELNHRLSVEGGIPSDYYRFIQKAGWVLSPFIIIALMIASFVVTI